MKVILIAAVEKNNGIGKDNAIPWKLKADMQFFKQTTSGNTVIMGRRTFESLGSKPLPNRHNVVISSQLTLGSHYHEEAGNGYKVFPTLLNAMNYLLPFVEGRSHDEKVYLIGGSKIYEEGMQFASEILLTRINKSFDCDTFFPIIPNFPTVPNSFHLIHTDNHVGPDFEYSFNHYVRQP